MFNLNPLQLMKKLFTTSRTTEVGDASERFVTLFKKETSLADDAFLVSLFDEIQTLSIQITKAIKRDIILSELEDADNHRDGIIRSLSDVLKGYRSIPIPAMKDAGEKLYAVFSKYGLSMTRENYTVESSLIESLLKDLSAPELQTPITTLLGVPECISELREAQTIFNEKRLIYEKTLVAQSQEATASQLKVLLLNAINAKLVPYLIAMRLVNIDKYGNFSNTIAQIIDDTNASVKRRSTTRDKKKKYDKPDSTDK